MTDKEIVDYLRKKEEKYPVNEWVIQGRHIWPLIKMIMCAALSSEDTDGQLVARSQLNKILKKFGNYKDVLSGIDIGNETADVMIFHHNNARHLSLDDSSEFDTNLDPFTLMLEDKYNICSLEYMASSNHESFFRNSTVVDGVIQRAVLRSKFICSVDEKKVSLNGYEQFLGECEIGLKEKLSVINIYRTITFMNNIASFFAKIIRKKNIKLVIAGCGYGTDTAALFMACKDVGVKCMEVQHGLAAGNGHRWYSSWTKMPNDGARYEMLPDIYWCWSHEDESVLNSWVTGRHIVYVGGKPVYNVMNELEVLTKGNSFIPEKHLPNILFTLQPEVNYPEWIVEMIKDTCSEYNWIIRKHPRFDICQAKLIDMISNLPNVYIDGISSIMLEKLLMCADVHVTNHSAVVMDALEFGVKSIILTTEHADAFIEQIEANGAYEANKDNFISVLNLIIFNKKCVIKGLNDRQYENVKFIKEQLEN